MIFSDRLEHLKPYTPGEQPQDRKYIKLNTNENPYPPSPLVMEELRKLEEESLRLYPDPEALKLRSLIAEENSLSPDQVFAGNGSDEVLSFAFYAFFSSSGPPILFPEHTYSFYPVYCGFYGIPFSTVPLRKDFSVSLRDFISYKSQGVIFPNPNAPTGIGLPLSEVAAFLKDYGKERPVIIDEAYIEFGGESALPLMEEFSNLLIVRTFSKSKSLAGLRVGYALGSSDVVSALFRVKDSFNSYPLDAPAQRAAGAALKDKEYYSTITKRIIEERRRFSEELTLQGFEVLPSLANFVFTRKRDYSGLELYKGLREEGILVRYLDKPGLKDFVRITIGKKEDMDSLLSVLREIF